MRQNFNIKSFLVPEPVCIIATYNKDMSIDIMNAARAMMADFDKVCICLSKDHLTTENILRTKAFTLSAGTLDTVTSCDYVGIVSGKDEKNKLQKSLFHTVKSQLVNAPLIEELPLALECELINYDKEKELLFAKIVNVSVDQKIIDSNGKIDLEKAKLICYDPTSSSYMEIGKRVAKAFNVGKKLK
ncbi:MAG: flavin reductase [Mollicutes bacterium]|nr:flavin reductase [Mollicutes bacterium]MDD7264420.1 flavin reductase [bacterium]MDY4979112.1 flavin reductase [Candidatus Onthovivens sp.]